MEAIEVERMGQLRDDAGKCEISFTSKLGLRWGMRLTDNNLGQLKSH